MEKKVWIKSRGTIYKIQAMGNGTNKLSYVEKNQ